MSRKNTRKRQKHGRFVNIRQRRDIERYVRKNLDNVVTYLGVDEGFLLIRIGGKVKRIPLSSLADTVQAVGLSMYDCNLTADQVFIGKPFSLTMYGARFGEINGKEACSLDFKSEELGYFGNCITFLRDDYPYIYDQLKLISDDYYPIEAKITYNEGKDVYYFDIEI